MDAGRRGGDARDERPERGRRAEVSASVAGTLPDTGPVTHLISTLVVAKVVCPEESSTIAVNVRAVSQGASAGTVTRVLYGGTVSRRQDVAGVERDALDAEVVGRRRRSA